MNYKLQAVGIDTTNLDYSPLKQKVIKDAISYVLTNPAANNGFMLSDFLNYLEDAKLVTEINYVDGVDEVLVSHLKELGRDHYDLLMMNGDLDYQQFDLSVDKIKSLGIVKNYGLASPSSLTLLKSNVDYLRAIGVEITGVSLNICPFYLQKDILDYCKTENILVYGTNPFGGWFNFRTLVYQYSAPYLLNFTAFYSDIVFLSSRIDMGTTINACHYLSTLIDKGVVNPELFTAGFENNINKLISFPKKKISTALLIEGTVLPYDNPEYLFNPEEIKLNDGSIFPEIKRTEYTETEDKVINSLVPLIYKAENISDDDYFALIRYKIEDYLEISHSGWEKLIIKVTDKIFYLKYSNITKKTTWFGKIKKSITKTDQYLLFFSNGIFDFKEISLKKDLK